MAERGEHKGIKDKKLKFIKFQMGMRDVDKDDGFVCFCGGKGSL